MSTNPSEVSGNPAENAIPHSQTLRIASYNIQVGVAMDRYHHYLTHSLHHVLPNSRRQDNLNRVAALIRHFDIVALQEVDAGSLRSGFVNQGEYLARRAGFEYWSQQTNRNLGKLAQHSNVLLSRWRPSDVEDHKLPGLPGRGTLVTRFGEGDDAVHVCVVHLALGKRARGRQLGYIAEMLTDFRHAIVMGDFNCSHANPDLANLMQQANLFEPACEQKTFPSWQPLKKIDHILVSSDLEVENVRVLNHPLSDHLPIAMNVRLPAPASAAA